MGELLAQIGAALGALTGRRKVGLIVTLAATLGILSLAGWYGSRPDLIPLYPTLGSEDSAAVLAALRRKGVVYDVMTKSDGSTVVEVPRAEATRLRMELAQEGIPTTSVVEGWSILDKAPFGESDFKQRVNRVRALQGELARTISELGNVTGARVHLAIPERRTLQRNREMPSASVALRLRPNAQLTPAEVKSIAHLVAQSVPGMSINRVTIVDDHGRLLHKPKSQDDGAAEVDERSQKLEQEMEANIVRILESVVGTHKVVANVTLDFDYAKVEQTEESFDPDLVAVRSEQKSTDTHGEKSGTLAGIPGVRAVNPNVPAGEQAVAEGPTRSANTSRLTDVTNYEISKTVKRTTKPAGAIRRISVAVLVDGRYVEQGEERVFQPRSTEELEQLNRLVKTVVGFVEKRGDSIELTQAPFEDSLPATIEDAPVQDTLHLLRPYIPLAVMSLLSLIALAVFARPLRRLLNEVANNLGINNAAQSAGNQAATKALAAENAAALGGSQAALATTGAAALNGSGTALGLPEPQTSTTSLDTRLTKVLDEIGDDESQWDNTEAMSRRTQQLEGTVREIATENPESVAEALTTWMNDRHVQI